MQESEALLYLSSRGSLQLRAQQQVHELLEEMFRVDLAGMDAEKRCVCGTPSLPLAVRVTRDAGADSNGILYCRRQMKMEMPLTLCRLDADLALLHSKLKGAVVLLSDAKHYRVIDGMGTVADRMGAMACETASNVFFTGALEKICR